MLETLSTNTTGAEIAIIVSLIAIILSLYTLYWARKQSFITASVICKVRDDTEDAIIVLRELLERTNNEKNSDNS